MALLSGVGGSLSNGEALVYYHWVMTYQLLEIGISWDAIHEMTENQINTLLGVVAAMKQKEQEAEARSQASQMRGSL